MSDAARLAARLSAWTQGRAEAMQQLWAALVTIASPTGDAEGNEQCLEILEAGYGVLGFTPTRVPAALGREHLVLTRTGQGGAPRVMLIGHTDTVFAADAGFDGFTVEGELARGPGVADMKGGLVVMLSVAQALAQVGRLDDFDWVVVINTDEEQQSETSRELVETRAAGAQLALVFESGRASGALVKARRGTGRFTLTTRGRAAHAGQAHGEGLNAIVELAAKVGPIAALSDPARGVTVNCGLVSGGTRANVVPERAELVVDARADDPAGAAWLAQRMSEIAAAVVVEGCETAVSGGIARPPWPENEPTERLVETWTEAGRLLGQTVTAEVTGGGSDGNFTRALGVPTLDGLGPRGGGYHTAGEWAEVASLPARVALTALALTMWRETLEG